MIVLGTMVKGSGTVHIAGVPTNATTITVGNKTYTWQTTLTETDGNVFNGADVTAAVSNLVAAINVTGTATQYATTVMTKHTQVAGTVSASTGTVSITALDYGQGGNAVATSVSGTAANNVTCAQSVLASGAYDGTYTPNGVAAALSTWCTSMLANEQLNSQHRSDLIALKAELTQ